MKKEWLLPYLFFLTHRDGGDRLGQQTLFAIQELLQQEMDELQRRGRLQQEKWPNGFPHTVNGKPWQEWLPVESPAGDLDD